MLRATLITCMLLISACSDGCGNEELARVISPDGRHVAIIFERSCGATTGFSTQISVLKKGRDVAGSGNTFVVDSDHGTVHRDGWEGPIAEATWLSSDHLLVSYAARSRIFKQVRQIEGVTVSYEPVEP